jgi:hypothetical protein
VVKDDDVERIGGEIEALVAQRQALRAGNAGSEALERNRIAICNLQRRLAYALIARYLPAAEAA